MEILKIPKTFYNTGDNSSTSQITMSIYSASIKIKSRYNYIVHCSTRVIRL